MKGKIRNNKKTSLLLSLWLLAAFFPSNSKRQESCNVCDVMVLVNNCFCIWKNAVNKMEREEVNLSWGKSIIFGAFGYSCFTDSFSHYLRGLEHYFPWCETIKIFLLLFCNLSKSFLRLKR